MDHGGQRTVTKRCFSSLSLSSLALLSKLEEAVVAVGQDTQQFASGTEVQMRAENPAGRPGASASSGDKRPGEQEHRGWSAEQGLEALGRFLYGV